MSFLCSKSIVCFTNNAIKSVFEVGNVFSSKSQQITKNRLDKYYCGWCKYTLRGGKMEVYSLDVFLYVT